MVYVVLGIVAFAGAVVAAALLTRAPRQREREARRRRYALQDSGQPVPLRSPATPASPRSLVEDTNWLPEGPLIGVPSGRLVQTPDGEMILTDPPFKARQALLTHRAGRYVNALGRRLPPWVVVCPRVRLESLVTPTRPDGRDPADWRQWRKRVRLRAVDLVLCDRRTWRPLLAIVLEPSADRHALVRAGGRDRVLEEVLAAAGIPLVRGSGVFQTDWPMVRPYVDQAILRSPSDDELEAASKGPDLDGKVDLLRLESDKGWLLE